MLVPGGGQPAGGPQQAAGAAGGPGPGFGAPSPTAAAMVRPPPAAAAAAQPGGPPMGAPGMMPPPGAYPGMPPPGMFQPPPGELLAVHSCKVCCAGALWSRTRRVMLLHLHNMNVAALRVLQPQMAGCQEWMPELQQRG